MVAFRVRPRVPRPVRGRLALFRAIGSQATTGAVTLASPTGAAHAIGHQATTGRVVAGGVLGAVGVQATTAKVTPTLLCRGRQATTGRAGAGGLIAWGRQGTRALVTPAILCFGRQTTRGSVAVGGGGINFANGYGYRALVEIAPQPDLSGTVANIVLRLTADVLAATALKTTGNGGVVRSTSGFDIRLEPYGAAVGAGKLDHQFVTAYGPTAGAVDLRFRAPSWDVTTPYRLWLYAGKAALSATEENPTGLWQGAMRATRLDTGADLSGGSRVLTPSGVTAGGTLAGMPAGTFGTASYCRKTSPPYVPHLTAATNEIIFQLASAPGATDSGNLDRVGGTPLSAEKHSRYSSFIYQGGKISAGANWYDPATGNQTNESVETAAGTVAAALVHCMAVRQVGQATAIYVNGASVPVTALNPPVSGSVYLNVIANDEDVVGAGQGTQDTALPGLYALDVQWPAALSAAFVAMRYRSEVECRSVAGMGAFDAFGDTDQSPVAVPLRATNAGAQADYDVVPGAFDPDGDPITLTAVGSSTHAGDVTSLTGGKVRYKPQPLTYSGLAEVPFTIGDGRGKGSSSRLWLSVSSVVGAGPVPMFVPNLPASFQRIANDAALTSFLNGSPNPANVYALVSKDVSLAARTISQAIGSKAHPLYIVAERNSADEEDFAHRATIGKVKHGASFAWLDGFHFTPPNNDHGLVIDTDDTFVTRSWFDTDYTHGGVTHTAATRCYRTRIGFCLFNSVDRTTFSINDIEQDFLLNGVGTTNPDYWDMYGNAHVSTETKTQADNRVNQNGMALYAAPGFDPPGTDPGDIAQHNSYVRRAFIRTTTKHGLYMKHVPNVIECDGTYTSSDGLHPYGSHVFAFRGGSSRYGVMRRVTAAGQPGSNSTGGQAIALQSWNHELGWCEATTGPIRLYCLCTGPSVKPLQAARYAYVYRCTGTLVLGAVRDDSEFTPSGKLQNVVVEAHTGSIIDGGGKAVTFNATTGAITSSPHPWIELTGPDACKIFTASSKPIKPAFSLTRADAGPGGGPQTPWDGVGTWPAITDFA